MGMINVKLTSKEKKAIQTFQVFLQQWKDCKTWEEKHELLSNMDFQCRTVISMAKVNENETDMFLACNIIESIIAYLDCKSSEDKIDDIADRFDEEYQKRLDDLKKSYIEMVKEKEETEEVKSEQN